MHCIYRCEFNDTGISKVFYIVVKTVQIGAGRSPVQLLSCSKRTVSILNCGFPIFAVSFLICSLVNSYIISPAFFAGKIGGKMQVSHRIAFMFLEGPVPIIVSVDFSRNGLKVKISDRFLLIRTGKKCIIFIGFQRELKHTAKKRNG